MITHTSGDVNLNDICTDINKYISGYAIRHYHIYGLKQERRPHIQILGSANVAPLVQLVQDAGYTILTSGRNLRYCEDCDEKHYAASATSARNCCCSGKCNMCDPSAISIGLRLDIRRNPVAARKLIKTIIFGIEGKLVVDPRSKLDLGAKIKKSKRGAI